MSNGCRIHKGRCASHLVSMAWFLSLTHFIFNEWRQNFSLLFLALHLFVGTFAGLRWRKRFRKKMSSHCTDGVQNGYGQTCSSWIPNNIYSHRLILTFYRLQRGFDQFNRLLTWSLFTVTELFTEWDPITKSAILTLNSMGFLLNDSSSIYGSNFIWFPRIWCICNWLNLKDMNLNCRNLYLINWILYT